MSSITTQPVCLPPPATGAPTSNPSATKKPAKAEGKLVNYYWLFVIGGSAESRMSDMKVIIPAINK